MAPRWTVATALHHVLPAFSRCASCFFLLLRRSFAVDPCTSSCSYASLRLCVLRPKLCGRFLCRSSSKYFWLPTSVDGSAMSRCDWFRIQSFCSLLKKRRFFGSGNVGNSGVCGGGVAVTTTAVVVCSGPTITPSTAPLEGSDDSSPRLAANRPPGLEAGGRVCCYPLAPMRTASS